MKALFSVFGLLIILSSATCRPEDQIASSEITGKWKLEHIVYHSMIAGEGDTTTEPSDVDIYEFHADGSFTRYRSTGDEATGTYTMKEDEGQQAVLAQFEDKASSCHVLNNENICFNQNGQVYFRLTEPNKLVESYIAADGPSFIYQKIGTDD